MSGGHPYRRRVANAATDAAANQRTADAVGEGHVARGDVARLIQQLQKDCGDGTELGRAVDAIGDRSPAYRLSYFRFLQNLLLRGAPR